MTTIRIIASALLAGLPVVFYHGIGLYQRNAERKRQAESWYMITSYGEYIDSEDRA